MRSSTGGVLGNWRASLVVSSSGGLSRRTWWAGASTAWRTTTSPPSACNLPAAYAATSLAMRTRIASVLAFRDLHCVAGVAWSGVLLPTWTSRGWLPPGAWVALLHQPRLPPLARLPRDELTPVHRQFVRHRRRFATILWQSKLICPLFLQRCLRDTPRVALPSSPALSLGRQSCSRRKTGWCPTPWLFLLWALARCWHHFRCVATSRKTLRYRGRISPCIDIGLRISWLSFRMHLMCSGCWMHLLCHTLT